jgi:hypothetical protein
MPSSNLDSQNLTSELFASWTPSEYIEKRIIQYQGWYDKKAVSAKKYYMYMKTIVVVGGIIIPFILNSPIPYKDIIASFISLVVTGLIALENVYHCREQWKNYRSTEQFLGKEQVLFLTGEGNYKNLESAQLAFIYLVERCEGAIEAENASTLNIMTLAQQEKK